MIIAMITQTVSVDGSHLTWCLVAGIVLKKLLD
jgi:hypothetical protein